MPLSEKGTVERVKARQGLLSKIQNVFTGGYATKEDLRELDRRLRDIYYEDLRELRHRWEKAYLEALEAGQSALGRHFKSVIQTLDRVSEQIHRADYGYAGLFDRKGHIREPELGSVFDYDKELGEHLERLGGSIEKVYSDVRAGAWKAVSDGVEALKESLTDIEVRWREREKRFRKLEV